LADETAGRGPPFLFLGGRVGASRKAGFTHDSDEVLFEIVPCSDRTNVHRDGDGALDRCRIAFLGFMTAAGAAGWLRPRD